MQHLDLGLKVPRHLLGSAEILRHFAGGLASYREGCTSLRDHQAAPCRIKVRLRLLAGEPLGSVALAPGFPLSFVGTGLLFGSESSLFFFHEALQQIVALRFNGGRTRIQRRGTGLGVFAPPDFSLHALLQARQIQLLLRRTRGHAGPRL
jgi:hypothetical protein